MNLFELFVKIGVKDEASNNISKISSGLGKGLVTAAKIGTAAVTAAATAVVALTKTAVDSFSEYEQLIGGTELMFGSAYETVMSNAQNAYKTVQMSQNEYLQQVNGFATGLKTALGGNEQAAADLAHKIVQAEADVVAATGNTAEAVRNAFNGIMKSNFTMLDNLQIGIPATKEGFQDVINKVNEWNAAQGEATNYQMGNLADMQSALVDYIDMVGMSGYAQREASETITGSLSSMKAAWNNLLTGLADKDADIGALVGNLVDSITGYVDEGGNQIKGVAQNIIPVIIQTVSGISSVIEGLAPVIADALPSMVTSLLPAIISAGTKLIIALGEAIITALPAIGTSLLTATEILLTDVFGVSQEKASAFSDGVTGAFDVVKQGFFAMVEQAQTDGTWLNEVWTKLQTIAQMWKDVAVAAFEAIKNAFAQCVEQVNTEGTLLNTLWTGLQNAVTFLLDAYILAFDAIKSAFASLVENANTEGTWLNEIWTGLQETAQALCDFLVALWDAISTAFTWCVEQINTEGTVLNAIWENIKTYASMVWDNVKIIISTAVDYVKGVIRLFTAVLRGDWSAAWDEVKNIASTVWSAIGDIISNIVDWVVGFLDRMVELGISLTNSLIDGMASIFATLWDTVSGWVTDNIITPITNFGTDLYNAGVDLINQLWDGLKSVWDSIASWWDGLSFSDKEVNVSQNSGGGGFATGLNYVPYDEFPAILHRGEAVLTAAEARIWRKNGLGGVPVPAGGVTINQYIQSVPQTPVDLANATEAYFEQARWAI